MKKSLILLLTLALLLPCAAMAEDDAWLCPNGHVANHNYCSWCGLPREYAVANGQLPVSSNDLQLEQTISLTGIGDVTLKRCTYYQKLFSGTIGQTRESADNEEYLVLEADILNTNTSPRTYLPRASVQAVYDGRYLYQGEVLQLKKPDYNQFVDDEVALDPMYNAPYAFACKLPSAVLSGSGELKLILTLDDVQLTYYVRK